MKKIRHSAPRSRVKKKVDIGLNNVTDKFIDEQIEFVWNIYQRLMRRGFLTLSKKEYGHHLYLLIGSLYSIKLFECITDRLIEKPKGQLKLTRNKR